jgi:hypothetical protein
VLAAQSIHERSAHIGASEYVALLEGFNHFVTSMTARLLPAGAVAEWASHPLESAAFHGARHKRSHAAQLKNFETP